VSHGVYLRLLLLSRSPSMAAGLPGSCRPIYRVFAELDDGV